MQVFFMLINLEELHSYNSIVSAIINLHNNYPSILTINSIGQSHDGREILCIRLGRGKCGPVMLGGVHGRERVNPIVLVAILARYCEQYDSKYISALDDYCIYFIPVLNPDGYDIAISGFGAISGEPERQYCQSLHIPWEKYKYNTRGIDINRNFRSANFMKTRHSGNVFSENESLAFMNFCQEHDTMGMIDFHSRGESIYYHRSRLSEEYNNRQFYLAGKLAGITGYSLNMPFEENIDGISGGNSVNYYSETFEKPALTVETVEEQAEFPLAVEHQGDVYLKIKDIPMQFLFHLLR